MYLNTNYDVKLSYQVKIIWALSTQLTPIKIDALQSIIDGKYSFINYNDYDGKLIALAKEKLAACEKPPN